MLYDRMRVRVCVCVCECLGSARSYGGAGGGGGGGGDGGGGGCGQDYCSAIIPRPSQRCSHEPGGLWVLLVPTENHGGGGEGGWAS